MKYFLETCTFFLLNDLQSTYESVCIGLLERSTRCFMLIEQVLQVQSEIEIVMSQSNYYPRCILLIAGKRKCGKDYLAVQLQHLLGSDRCEIIHISKPIKEFWAQTHHLNLDQLLSDNEYKEQYRMDMVRWSEDIRNRDYGYFIRQACNESQRKDIWIISDVRRRTDIQYFNETYPKVPIKCIKVLSSSVIREQRGWIFTEGIDDAATECDLDNWSNWDFLINNDDNDPESIQKDIQDLVNFLRNIQ